MRYSIPFEAVGHRWGLHATAAMIIITERAAFAVRVLHLHVSYEDSAEHNAALSLWRGSGGTATREVPAGWVPKGDCESRTAPFLVRSGFRVEPRSVPADWLANIGAAAGTTIGPLYYGPRQLIIEPSAGLRLLAASQDEWPPLLRGTVVVDVFR
jgi:hypothetical protein